MSVRGLALSEAMHRDPPGKQASGSVGCGFVLLWGMGECIYGFVLRKAYLAYPPQI